MTKERPGNEPASGGLTHFRGVLQDLGVVQSAGEAKARVVINPRGGFTLLSKPTKRDGSPNTAQQETPK